MAVSAGWLNGLLHLHLQSIEPVFYRSQLHLFLGVASSLDQLRAGNVPYANINLALRSVIFAKTQICFQLLSRIAWLFRDPVGSLIHYWLRLGVPFVLSESCPQMQTLPTDSNHTVSRRIEPSSRSLLIGEHPHPWLLMHSQDRESRQRSSKPPGRSI